MPVRIYEIAKKLGVESKEVLVKAKELGITAAKVPSSSLDKITAEYLEQQLAAKLAPAGSSEPQETAPPPPAAAPTPVIILTAPPAAPEPPPVPPVVVVAAAPEPEVQAHPAPVAPSPEPKAIVPAEAPSHEPAAPIATPANEVEPAPAPVAEVPAAPVVVQAHAVSEAPAPAAAPTPAAPPIQPPAVAASTPAVSEPASPAPAEAPAAPKAPEAPAAPKIGDKVGFIKLPTRPAPRQPDRPPLPQSRFGQRPGGPGLGNRMEPPRGRPDGNRDVRGPGQGRPVPGQAGQRSDSSRPGSGPGGEARFVPPSEGEKITLKPPVVVRDLAERLRRKPFQLIADLMEMGVFANVNQGIDELTAQKICAKYGFRFEVEKRERGGGIVHAPVRKAEPDIIEDKPEQLKPRAPVVTIMGHVDHGKTTLLDVIRKANVAAGESGGITQHIGAYTISIPHPERPTELQQITFLDTPGHAAFSSMRARGANVTDIVVLVVAANDGVMPQTLEALSHAQAAKVPIMVAVNKCDHPNANPMKVRQQLQEKGLVCEEWGGSTIFVDLSAVTKKGVDKLLEMLVLQSEVMELKANPDRRAKGNVIESGLEPGGPMATVLVRKGTLRVGDAILCGEHWGKVRALINEEGTRLKEAAPSVAVRVLGLNGVPEAGVEFIALENDKTARDMAEERAHQARNVDKERRPKVTLENLFDTLAAESNKTLKVVVKADTQGSVEAIVEAIRKIESTKVALDVVHSAVGTITKEDVVLASASSAIVLGFHTRVDNGIAEIAKREGVQIKLYAIIYELIDQVKEAMAGLLDPLLKEVVMGSAEVRKIFALSKGGNIAGCAVSSGRIVKGKVRVMRRKGLIFEGLTSSLRRFQDEVNEVRSGMECGIRLDGFDDFQVGDVIECYTLEKVAQKL